MKFVTLFSRDKRTADNFRNCWVEAFKELGYQVEQFYRKENSKNHISSLFRFHRKSINLRMIFGTSEILLFSIISNSKDVWVFTGLGRILDGSNHYLKLFSISVLKILYRNQKIICLNAEDKQYLTSIFGNRVYLILGEGYYFSENVNKTTNQDFVVWAYVGRLLKSKGVHGLIESFLKSKKDNHILRLFGDSDFNNSDSISQKFIDRAIRLSQGSIIFEGYSEDIKSELRKVDFVISLSQREGMPFAILDAIDAGCSCILSNVPGHKDLAFLSGIKIVEIDEIDKVFQSLATQKQLILSNSRANERLNEAKNTFGNTTIKSKMQQILTN